MSLIDTSSVGAAYAARIDGDGATRAKVRELAARDREVRQHEQAHARAAGSLALSGPSYEFTVGPDGRRYAVSGEVRIDTAPVPDDPEATIDKAERIIRAALAPSKPSPQDRQVAAKAAAMAASAKAELAAREARGSVSLDRVV